MEFLSQLPKITGTTIVDTHAHYDDEAFDDVSELLPAIYHYGVCKIITSGTDDITNQKAVELAEQYDFVYATVGFHPELVDSNSSVDHLEQYLSNPKVVAVGEIGLDYHYRDDNKDLQKRIFAQQIELAQSHQMPIVVHDRDAHGDTLEILKKYKPKGTVHCYSGSVEMARELVDMGMYIGMGGVVTFKNARKTVEVIEQLPLERIVLETDAPYLAPTPFRGKRNHSAFISLVAQRIADIKNVSLKQVLDTTTQNAVQLYNLT